MVGGAVQTGIRPDFDLRCVGKALQKFRIPAQEIGCALEEAAAGQAFRFFELGTREGKDLIGVVAPRPDIGGTHEIHQDVLVHQD